MRKPELPRRLHVCFIAKEFPILGRAADYGFLWPIARGLAQRQHDVTILSWQNPDHREMVSKDNVVAYFLGEGENKSPLPFPKLLQRKFRELNAQNPFHVVHSLDRSGFEIGRYRKNGRYVMAYDVEATHMSQLISILGRSQETVGSIVGTALQLTWKYLTTFLRYDRPLLHTADAVFVTSPGQKIGLERYYLYPEVKIHTIPYGIEIGDLSPREKSAELRQKLGFQNDSQVVVTVSDMSDVSEMSHLLRAFERVVIKKPSARMVIVGDGEKRKEIEFEMLSLALGNKVVFTGSLSAMQLPDHIALADVFVNLSSRTTGFEPSILEAMAQKKVVIGSEVSPIATVVEDGKDGFLIRPADTEALAQLLLGVFSHRVRAEALGENARQKVIGLFDTRRMVDQTLQAYIDTLIRTGVFRKPPKPAAAP